MSDLRIRIAAALYDHWWHGTTTLKEPPLWEKLSELAREGWLRQADAVIRELQLGKEKGCGCLPEGHACTCSYRYVSTWSPCGKADDE